MLKLDSLAQRVPSAIWQAESSEAGMGRRRGSD